MDNTRKTPRAGWIDYDHGLFFITICTKARIHYFGDVMNGEMILSEIGKIVDKELSHPEIHHPEIYIPLYCVMPNHIHAIVGVDPTQRANSDMGCHIPSGLRNPNPSQRVNPDVGRHVPTLSKYIASMKSSVSKLAHLIDPDFGWQTRYHDHIIRGSKDGTIISDYILNNPRNWNKDCFYE